MDIIGYLKFNKTVPFQTCICDQGWTDISSDAQVKCCYKRKQQFVAFLFEFCLGFGAGHFYLGNNYIGVLKAIVYSILCCTCCTIGCCFCFKDDESVSENLTEEQMPIAFGVKKKGIVKVKRSYSIKIFNFVMVFSIYVYIFWQIADSILFGLNFFTDGNGVTLAPW